MEKNDGRIRKRKFGQNFLNPQKFPNSAAEEKYRNQRDEK